MVEGETEFPAHMKAWFKEDVLRRVLRNTGLQGIGKIAGAVLHLATLSLTARWLGPVAFGLLILSRSYAQAASGLAKFQSWQTLIRFGAVPAEREDIRGFRDLAAFTLTVDTSTGVLAAIAAALLAPYLAGYLGLTSDSIWLAQVYCLVIPLLTSATPVGILRTFDRFDRFSWQSVLTPTARLVGLLIAGAFGAPLWACVLAWLVSDIIGELFLWFMAAIEMRKRGFMPGPPASPRRALAAHPGIVRFALATNVGATLNQSLTPLFTLTVGGLLGTASAGVFRIAQITIEAVSTPVELAMRSMFPEAARLLERDSAHFWRVIRRAAVLSTALGLAASAIVILFGPLVLSLAMGHQYEAVGPVLRIVALAFVAFVMNNVLETALLALGAAGRILFVRLTAAACSFGLLALLAPEVGLAGAGIAVAIAAFVTLVGMVLTLAAEQRALRSAGADGA